MSFTKLKRAWRKQKDKSRTPLAIAQTDHNTAIEPRTNEDKNSCATIQKQRFLINLFYHSYLQEQRANRKNGHQTVGTNDTLLLSVNTAHEIYKNKGVSTDRDIESYYVQKTRRRLWHNHLIFFNSSLFVSPFKSLHGSARFEEEYSFGVQIEVDKVMRLMSYIRT